MKDFIGNELKVGSFVACAQVHGVYAYTIYRAKIVAFREHSVVVEFENGEKSRSIAEGEVLSKLVIPLSDKKSKGRIHQKDAIGQDIVPGSKVAFARARKDRDSKGFLYGGIVTRTTDSFVFARVSEDAPEVKKTLDKTVVIG